MLKFVDPEQAVVAKIPCPNSTGLPLFNPILAAKVVWIK